jgi:carboxylesterase
MRAALPKISAPVLLIYSHNDPTVEPKEGHAEQIYAALGNRDKQTLWVENSGHLITEDAERQRVFQAVAEFVARVGNTPR